MKSPGSATLTSHCQQRQQEEENREKVMHARSTYRCSTKTSKVEKKQKKITALFWSERINGLYVLSPILISF